MTAQSIRKHPNSSNKNQYQETYCKECGKAELRRVDAIKVWGGRCCSCAMRERLRDPALFAKRKTVRLATISNWSQEKKDAFAEKARQQVLRQGGIPNAKRFVREGQEGRRMAGSSHYAWKGGINLQNKEGRRSRRAAAWRVEVLRRDDYTCQLCGVRGGKLHADHILPWASYPELRFELSNGRTLCIPCHRTTPTYGWRGNKSSTVIGVNSIVAKS